MATKYKLPGGILCGAKTLFDELEEVGIVVDKDRFYPWFAVYDFEALLEVLHDSNSDAKLQWSRKHRAISVSVNSNIDNFDQSVCFVDLEEEQLITEMVNYLHRISEAAEEFVKTEVEGVFESLKALIPQLNVSVMKSLISNQQRSPSVKIES